MTTTYLLDDIAEFLSALSPSETFGAGTMGSGTIALPLATLGLIGGTNLFVGIMPDNPDTSVSLFEYTGRPPEYVMGAANSLPAMAMPHLQLVVRSVDVKGADAYVTARAQCEAITRALESIVNQYVNTTYYLRIERLQDPFFMQRDGKRRVYFACNFDCTRTPS